MKRFKRGITLLITTIVLSFVTITTSAFSAIYFRYVKMNSSFISSDYEKISLRSDANIAYEHFLKDSEVKYGEENKKLRSELLLSSPGLAYQQTISVQISNFIASFRCESSLETTCFNLCIEGSKYKINSLITKQEGDSFFSLSFGYIEARGNL